MPLSDDPLHEFEDLWSIKFTVNDQVGRNQVKTIEDEEMAIANNNDSPFIYQDDIFSSEIVIFSLLQTSIHLSTTNKNFISFIFLTRIIKNPLAASVFFLRYAAEK